MNTWLDTVKKAKQEVIAGALAEDGRVLRFYSAALTMPIPMDKATEQGHMRIMQRGNEGRTVGCKGTPCFAVRLGTRWMVFLRPAGAIFNMSERAARKLVTLGALDESGKAAWAYRQFWRDKGAVNGLLYPEEK
jgi:hypothetical protein